MSKSKVVLTAKIDKHKDDFNIAIKEKGDLSICITMGLKYVADKIVENDASLKEVTQLLKTMVKDEQERRGNGTWL